MKIPVKEIINKEKISLILLLIILLLLSVVFVFINKYIPDVSLRLSGRGSEIVRVDIEKEKERALFAAEEIAALPSLNSYIKQDDRENAFSIISREKIDRDLDFVIVANKYGMALAGVPDLGSYGDSVFQTQPWGRAVAKNEPVAMLANGANFPLSIVGAHPIVEENEVKGAVFSGYLLDNRRARDFKDKYFKDSGTDIAFYSRESGIKGSSFQDEYARELLDTYFNSGADWVGRGYFNGLVGINGNRYLVENYAFSEGAEGEEAGGVLVFVLRNISLESFIFALFVSIIFSFIALCLCRRHKHERRHCYVVGAMIVITFVYSFFMYRFVLEGAVTHLNKPSLIIYNSVLKIDPESDIIDLSRGHRAFVRAETGGETINVVRAVVNYDPALLRVEDISFDNSFCNQQFVLERSIDNEQGEVVITCGVPNPGFGGNGIVAELQFQPLVAGDVAMRFGPDSQVLAADGLGTNVLRMATSANYKIFDFRELKGADGFSNILLFSPSHPNGERWYNKKEISVFWPATGGDGYVYSIDRHPLSAPSIDWQTIKTNSASLTAPEDGTYYVHIATLKDGKIFGSAGHLKVNVDTTSPSLPKIKASAVKVNVGGMIRFEFDGSDDVSGIQPIYYYQIDNGIGWPVGKSLSLPLITKGWHTLMITVFDNAGNYRTSAINIEAE